MGYNCCFFLNFVPLHIESPYNFGGTGPILGGTKLRKKQQLYPVVPPVSKLNGHPARYKMEKIMFS